MAGTLYIDVEWNQVGDVSDVEVDEIVQVAMIGVWDEGKDEKRCFRMVRPEHIEQVKDSTYRLMNISEEILRNAKPLGAVLDTFFKTFQGYGLIVMWNREAYDVYVRNVARLGHRLPRHRVVIVQEMLGGIVKVCRSRVSFPDALKAVGIEYNEHMLHCAKHDVNYLYQLYKALGKQYLEKCVGEDFRTCYVTPSTKTLHAEGCRYIAGRQGDESCKTSVSAIFEGYRICRMCSKSDAFRKLKWKIESVPKPQKKSKVRVSSKAACRKTGEPVYRKMCQESFTDEYIRSVCEHYGVACNVGVGIIFIRTNVATWRIYHDRTKVTSVYHENYRYEKDRHAKRLKLNEGFHKQNVKYTRLDEVVRYIESHDRVYLERGLKRKSRVEELLEMVGE